MLIILLILVLILVLVVVLVLVVLIVVLVLILIVVLILLHTVKAPYFIFPFLEGKVSMHQTIGFYSASACIPDAPDNI